MAKDRLILLEINEFNPDYMGKLATQYGLVNLTRLLGLPKTMTEAYDEFEHNGLDPWVQWVSIHTGVLSDEHKVIRLGEVDNLAHKQIWEVLSEQGLSSGIWGAMNATRRGAENCKFFLPDPWVYMEAAHPSELNSLLKLPRHFAKNYLDLNYKESIVGLFQLVFFIARSGVVIELLSLLPHITKGFFSLGLSSSFLFSTFDLLNVVLFNKYKRTYKTDFSLVFLNSIAHFQHNYWYAHGDNPHAEYVMKTMDIAVGKIFNATEANEDVLIANGLTQVNIDKVKEDVLYRQINPQVFFTDMNIRFSSVEQNMTNDGFLLFDCQDDLTSAIKTLTSSALNGENMFQIESVEGESFRAFYQLLFWGKADATTVFTLNDREYTFYDYFEKVVTRTGEHIKTGYLYGCEKLIGKKIINTEIFNVVTQFFKLKS
jgi:hypothetical protein